MSRMPTVIVCIVALAGCGEISAVRQDPAHHLYQAGAVLLGLDILSLTTTGKTLDDHLFGAAAEEDCSTVRLSQGGPYCVPFAQPVAMVSQTTYCYKSLASASCYPVPLASDQARYTGSRVDMVPAP
jgi:hypothetical protein